MTQAALDLADVMARVPRERFIPDVIWLHHPNRLGNDLVPVDRRTDPDIWAAMVAADEPVITQVDNGQIAPDGTGIEATSSCSDRSVVQEMLELLAPVPGERVLEIGTGTGWNAALLANLGVAVTSVEIDESLARRARQTLRQWGDIRVLHGDATMPMVRGVDRLIATVGTRVIPWAWIEQTRIGGRIVAPLNNAWFPPGLAVLERARHGAHGKLAGPAAFMSLRSEATSRRRPSTLVPDAPSSVDVHPYYLTGDRDAAVAIGQRTSGVSFVWRPVGDGSDGVLWIYGDESWATIDATAGAPYEVEQAGPRRLVDEVITAYRWWQDSGEPKVGDWTVTVTETGQTIKL